MKTKTTIILLLIAALLGAYIFLIETKLPTTDELKEIRKKVFSVKANDITKIVINAPNASQMTVGSITPTRVTIICTRKDSGWAMIAPLRTRADKSTLDNIANQIADLQKKDTIKEVSNLATYGLLEPIITLTFHSRIGPAQTLKLGYLAPLNLGVYLSVEGRKEIYVVPEYFADTINKPVSDFRHKKVFDANIYEANNLEFIYPDKTIILEKNKDNQWLITSPVSEKADENKIRDLLSTMAGLCVDTFVADNETNLSIYGLDKPLLKIALKSEILVLGREWQSDKFVAMKESRPDTIFTINKTSYQNLMLSLDDLRTKRFFEIDHPKITNIRIKYNQKEVVNLEKDKNNNWQFVYPVFSGSDIAPYDVQGFLDKLNNTNIEQFCPTGITITDLAPYGLDEPLLELTLNTTTTLMGFVEEEVEEPETKLYFKQTDKPRIVAVDSSLWNYLQQGSIIFRKKTLFNIPTDKVKKLSIYTPEKGSLSYERTKPDDWQIISGKEISKSDLNKIMNEFCYLTASEFVMDMNLSASPDLAHYGLDKPEAIITMEYEWKGQVVTKSLHIGTKTENHYYAKIEDDVVVFKIIPSIMPR
jgi:hypothetical protein